MYPVVLRVEGRRCLVVGGGPVALRKVAALVAAGADVTVVAPDAVGQLEALARTDAIALRRRPYRPEDLDGAWLAVVATDDPNVQQAVFDDGEQARVWVNAADDPERCSFFLPAVHRREPVIVAVSTQGASPALAGWLRDHLAAALPAHLEELVATLEAERRTVKDAGRSTEGLDWRARIDAHVARLEAAEDDDGAPPSK